MTKGTFRKIREELMRGYAFTKERQRGEHLRRADVRWCAEMMFMGSRLSLLPFVEWDGKPIGVPIEASAIGAHQRLCVDMKFYVIP
ncbi:hypothetical protein E2562_036981 [Oryza meyeriana var. granulata]|uniref:Uncharacterized protein n=1 Tax=Oryza meyeriana var. granulata TaxID=110450 RepID=A0A6G1F1W7_9ORYZ|nr:hypothetical protein E2562_036981 [Oryza meyeriana var. granulata]